MHRSGAGGQETALLRRQSTGAGTAGRRRCSNTQITGSGQPSGQFITQSEPSIIRVESAETGSGLGPGKELSTPKLSRGRRRSSTSQMQISDGASDVEPSHQEGGATLPLTVPLARPTTCLRFIFIYMPGQWSAKLAGQSIAHGLRQRSVRARPLPGLARADGTGEPLRCD